MKRLLFAAALLLFQGSALADSPIVRDSVGRVAGYYAGGTGPGAMVVSATGYTFALTGFGRVSEVRGPADGAGFEVNTLYYASANCAGPAYMQSYNNVSGFVLRSHSELLYAPKGTVAVNRTLQSRKTEGFCQGFGNTVPSLPLLPNDEAVTGVPNVDFVPPIEIVIARDVADVFRNGYEAPKT